MNLILIYKIVFILTAFGAGIIAVEIFTKKNKETLFERLFGFMSVAFVVWAIGRFGMLFATSKGEALSWAHFLYNGSILVHLLFLHTILVYLNIHKSITNKIILIVFYAINVFLLVLNNLYFLIGENYLIKDVVSKLGFQFYEMPDKFYLLHILNYIFIPAYCLIVLIKHFLKTKQDNKKQLILVILASFVGFLGGNSVIPLVYDIKLEPIALILVPFYLPILTYAITKYKLFDIKIITTEIFTFSLWIVILVRILLSDNTQEQIINIGLLLMTFIVGIFLIKSVYHEVSQREKIEKLALELKVTNTDLANANQKLKELDNLKSEFLSLASHQIRGPLTTIRGYASEILEGDFGVVSPKIKEAVQIISSSSECLIGIVEDFLNISRIEQGRMKYDMSYFDLSSVVKDVLEAWQPIFNEKKLALTYHITPKLIVNADMGKIRQVITNLVENSVKYTKEGGVFVDLVKTPNNTALLSIKDTGIGISEKMKSLLFQKFSRAENALKMNISGSGLGLYVASQMLRAQGGRIWVESPGEGLGSTFFVELKLALNSDEILS
jgi:signal transduction histidine kinase